MTLDPARVSSLPPDMEMRQSPVFPSWENESAWGAADMENPEAEVATPTDMSTVLVTRQEPSSIVGLGNIRLLRILGLEIKHRRP